MFGTGREAEGDGDGGVGARECRLSGERIVVLRVGGQPFAA
jgi:hypothetical protein